MSFRSHSGKIALFSIVFGALIIGVFEYSSHRELKNQTVDIFDKAFASKIVDRFGSPVLRVRRGDEIFCIQEPASASIHVGRSIADLSTTFELEWKQIHVENLIECPENTTFYILHDKQLPERAKLVELMLEVVGSTPPDKYFPESALGYSISLPGRNYREFAYIKMRDNAPEWATRSIISEELLHAITRASDVSVSSIVSLLGNHVVSDDYSLWFQHNPRGLCSVDIILMELLLSPSMSHRKHMDHIRSYLVSNFDELVDAAEIRAQNLVSYSDPRCWIW